MLRTLQDLSRVLVSILCKNKNFLQLQLSSKSAKLLVHTTHKHYTDNYISRWYSMLIVSDWFVDSYTRMFWSRTKPNCHKLMPFNYSYHATSGLINLPNRVIIWNRPRFTYPPYNSRAANESLVRVSFYWPINRATDRISSGRPGAPINQLLLVASELALRPVREHYLTGPLKRRSGGCA